MENFQTNSLSLLNQIVAILPLDNPSPVAFANVYEPGDLWIKVQGCEVCERGCCGNCGLFLKDTCQCSVHIIDKGSNKPFHCVVSPSPISRNSICKLVFRCVSGTNCGKFRWKCDDRDVLRDIGP